MRIQRIHDSVRRAAVLFLVVATDTFSQPFDSWAWPIGTLLTPMTTCALMGVVLQADGEFTPGWGVATVAGFALDLLRAMENDPAAPRG